MAEVPPAARRPGSDKGKHKKGPRQNRPRTSTLTPMVDLAFLLLLTFFILTRPSTKQRDDGYHHAGEDKILDGAHEIPASQTPSPYREQSHHLVHREDGQTTIHQHRRLPSPGRAEHPEILSKRTNW